MSDREKVIKDLEECLSASCRGFRPRLSCPYNDEEWDIMREAIALLKEQEKQKFFVDENGKITPLPVVVMCKDCKHGEEVNSVYLCGKTRGFGIAHEPDWFCADGERRDDDV